MSKKNVVARERVNSMLINDKLNMAIDEYNATNSVSFKAVEQKPLLRQVVLRSEIRKFPTGIPFYAFIKHGRHFTAMYNIKNGGLSIIPSHLIASETDVKNSFEVDGTKFHFAGTVNGFQRYLPDFAMAGSRAKMKGKI